MLIVYAKWNGTSRFHAFDLGNGVPVTRVIYASSYRASEMEMAKVKLQELCDEYKSINFKIQLRENNQVVWVLQ